MANIGKTPGQDTGEMIESRRTSEALPGLAESGIEANSDEPASDGPSFGELAPEAARPTPLDEIAEAEREQAPRD